MAIPTPLGYDTAEAGHDKMVSRAVQKDRFERAFGGCVTPVTPAPPLVVGRAYPSACVSEFKAVDPEKFTVLSISAAWMDELASAKAKSPKLGLKAAMAHEMMDAMEYLMADVESVFKANKLAYPKDNYAHRRVRACIASMRLLLK